MESPRPCCLDWRYCKIVGLTVGWLGVLANCGLIYGLCQHTGRFGGSLHETIIAFLPGKFHLRSTVGDYVLCLLHHEINYAFETNLSSMTGLNFVSSYSWLYGISKVSGILSQNYLCNKLFETNLWLCRNYKIHRIN